MPSDSLREHLRAHAARLAQIDPIRSLGKVADCVGLVVESEGPSASIGDLCDIQGTEGEVRLAQVIGFRENRVLLMPLEEPQGLQPGARRENEEIRIAGAGGARVTGPRRRRV